MTATDRQFRDEGLCAQTDPELFHSDSPADRADAKRVCHACPVQAQCLEYALTHDERFGVWGGTSRAERVRLRRAQQRPTRRQQRRVDKQATARRMYAAGASKAAICRAVGANAATVNTYLEGR